MSKREVARNGLLELQNLRETWHRNTTVFEKLFGAEGLARSTRARRSIDPDALVLVNAAWECPWAKSGGVAEVVSQLPRALSASFVDVVRICPLHQEVLNRGGAERDGNGSALQRPSHTTQVEFDGLLVDIEIFELTSTEGSRWHLFGGRSGEETFFRADGGAPGGVLPDGSPRPRKGTDPYFYSSETPADRDSTASRLLRDALFACKAVPAVLAALGLTENLIIHLHDWQMASVALSAAVELVAEEGCLTSAVTVLTMHNPFDHLLRGAHDDRLAAIVAPALLEEERWSFPFGAPSWKSIPDTVYECMLPLLDGPVAMVSPGFAAELNTEPLQRDHFAPHLQSPLAYTGFVGIQNGSFLQKADWRLYTDDHVRVALEGEAGPILEEKARRQREMIEVISSLRGSAGVRLAGTLRPATAETVFFHMAGRFDPSQKGFDLLVFAIERLLEREPRCDVRFIVTPMINGLEPPGFVEHLYSGASRNEGTLLVIEGRVEPRSHFLDLMSGATWSLWPSLYEPCGAASEPLALGTPVVARATGGLTRQIHCAGSPRELCGSSFREQVSPAWDVADHWRRIQGAVSPRERARIPLYDAMVEALTGALQRAVRLRLRQPESYAMMLARTSLQARDRLFAPETFAQGYLALYEAAIGAAPRPRPRRESFPYPS